MLLSINGKVTVESITSIFHSLVNLFSVKIEQDTVFAQRGLWAELFFMQKYGGFEFWASSWHSEPTRTFDFSAANLRTEIKCTIRPERIHEFSHSQLVSISDDKIVIVSYLLQEDDSGTSLQELIENAIGKFRGTHHFIKLERAIRKVNMNNPENTGPKFNPNHAMQNVAWFRSLDIPKFPIREPTGVTDTHYKSDLTQTPRLSEDEINTWKSEWGKIN